MTGRFPPVVVGVDGSPLAEVAARTGVEIARRRLLPVRLVRAFDWPTRTPTAPAVSRPAGREAARQAASAGLGRLRDVLAGEHPGVRVSAAVVDGPAVTVLVAESLRATLLVLGARGDGRLAEVLGPVRAAVFRRSVSPVLSAAATVRRDGSAPVVVGVDSDDDAATRHLLSAALLEAATRSSDLVVADLRRSTPGDRPAGVDLSVACRGLQSTCPAVRVRLEERAADSPQRLLDAGRDAQLLVVGRGSRDEPLPGPLRSVLAQSVVPVLLVPPAGDVHERGTVRALALPARS
nr:universal stress protein [Modestobacter marinus]